MAKTEEDEIIIVEDETQVEPEVEEDDHDEEDERVGRDPDDDGHDDDREALRARRREEKKERKERREQAIKRDKIEMDFLRKRNDDLERRLSAQEQRAHAGDLNAVDTAILQASKEAEMAERVIARAVEAGNGEDVAQALKYRDEARERIMKLSMQKQQVESAPPVRQNTFDDTVMHHAKQFMKDHPWYRAQADDEDSAIVTAIDKSLAREGFDPRTEDYWDELRRRTAKRLPERFEEPNKTNRNPRGGPAVGSGREHAPTSTRKEIYISPERKQALIDHGVWDDPVLRARYVKQFEKYDRENK